MTGSREERERVYRESADELAEMVRSHDEHMRRVPDCTGAPLCIGPAMVTRLATAQLTDRGYASKLVLVAVGEMSRMQAEIRQLSGSLEAQRGLTNDVARAHESAMERAAHAEDEQQILLGRIDDLEAQIGTMLAELTSWEEAADVLAPTGLVEPPATD